ncbi:MAG: hypothetical protein RIR18_761 [Pseudomonadota bacterium]
MIDFVKPLLDSVPAWVLAATLGVLLDRWLGEPKRWHPLVGFGRLVNFIEQHLNPWRRHSANDTQPFLAGILGWGLAVLPLVGIAIWIQSLAPFWVDALLLYFALGARSLTEHTNAIMTPLQENDLPLARERVSWLVSRETSTLDATGIANAATESVLENGHDAIFGTLFWFAIAGGPGALLFRLANTLDAMWGYRTERFNLFGRFAARADDTLGYFSARLTAITYAVLGNFRTSLRCWREQAPHWASPNAGPVMAAGAGSLGIQLGGPAMYYGHIEQRPLLGCGKQPNADDLARAIRLTQHGIILWLALFLAVGS